MPFYAVRVTLTHDDESTVSRIYVRGARRMSRTDFASFALGDLVRLTSALPIEWEVSEVTESSIHSEGN